MVGRLLPAAGVAACSCLAPGEVAQTIAENFFSSPYLANYHLGDGGLSASLVYTASNVLIALAISCVLGITLGFATAHVGLLRAILDPVVLTAGTIPILVTAPFFLIWFGTSRAAQIALLILYGTTIVYLFAQRAVANLDPVYVAAGRTLGASPRRVMLDVYLVGTLPEVFGGIRIALAGAWGLEAVSELLGAPQGIGRVIQAMALGHGHADHDGGDPCAGHRRRGLRRDRRRRLRVHHQMAGAGTPMIDTGRPCDGTSTAGACQAIVSPLWWRGWSKPSQT